MADLSPLAGIISGTNPLAPLMLQSYQGSQLSNAALDPAFAHNEGLAGALAKTLAGFGGNRMLSQGVQQTTDARQAANPDLARLLANPDPFSAVAANPSGVNPVALAQLLSGATPESVAETRLKAAQAGLAQANVAGIQRSLEPKPPMYVSDAPGGQASAPGMAGSPVGAQAPHPLANVGPAATSGLSARPSGDLDPTALAGLPPAQLMARLQRATPAQIAAYRARLQQLQGGAGNAVRPPT